ncbi:hypothetical protein McanCB49686_003118 [Microsporum canis]
MRSVEESRSLWNTTFHQPEIHSLHELKQVLEAGAKGANPCEDGLRSVCWKAILLHREIDRSQWSIQLSDSREAYTSVRQHFLKYINNPDELPSTVDPLAEDAELNPDLGYRQGMHELLAPILWVVTQDAIDTQTLNEDTAFAACGEEALMLQCLDPTYIEHDSFILFCSVMQTAKEFYEHNDSKNNGGNVEASSIISRSQHIHLGLLRKLDPELADHLVAIEVLPQIFLTRWIRLLFGREFPFEDVLALWDLIIAENVRSSLIDMICVSMLLRIRWQLMEADYSTALSLLLRYPSPEPIKPRIFVLDAVYLEHNTTFEGASYLVTKYSSKPIPQRAQNSMSPPIGASFPTRQKSRSLTRDIFNSPGSSPNRLTSKRLDSIFQDVSEGLYRRAEGWGVTKAVRGAVTEARRNMQGLQAGAANSTLFNHDGPAWDSPSPPRISFATVRELNLKVSTMEERNKALATMLDDALNTLQSQPSTAKEKNVVGCEGISAMDDAVARIRRVKACLEDATIPLGSGDASGAKQQPSITRSSEDSPTRREVDQADLQKTTDSSSSEQPSQQRSNGDTSAIIEASKEPQSPPSSINTPLPRTKRHPSRPTRTSVRDSSFSWILGDDQARPSFATSASAPPEQRREPLKSLFSDPEGDSRTAGGLLLSDLQHAPQSMHQQSPNQT